MKLRDKILYMSFGAGLIVLGMILNSLTGRYANAQEESVNVETNEQKESENVTFKNITCESIVSKTGFMIKDGSGLKAIIGLDDNGDAIAVQCFFLCLPPPPRFFRGVCVLVFTRLHM